MIQLYDEAVHDYFSSTVNSEVAVVPVNEFWTVVAMHKEGRLQLPAICLSRTNHDKDSELQSWVIKRRGRVDKVVDNKLFVEQALPLSLYYNITLLATTQDDIDELTSEVTFLIINRPTVQVKIPYGSDRYVHGQMEIDGEIKTSSTVDTFSTTGILYQAIIPVKIVGANIFNVEKRNLRYVKMCVRPDIINKGGEFDAKN